MGDRSDKIVSFSIVSFLLSPSLTYCAILRTSFGGKGPHLNRWLVAYLHQTVFYLRFSDIFLSRNIMHSPPFTTLSPLSLADRRDWHDTRGKRSLVSNEKRSWWYRHNSVKPFWPQTKVRWTTGKTDSNQSMKLRTLETGRSNGNSNLCIYTFLIWNFFWSSKVTFIKYLDWAFILYYSKLNLSQFA